MKSKRFLAIGALAGILIGVLISFLFPDLLKYSAEFNNSSRVAQGLPDYSPKSGSIFNSLMVMPMFLGILGGVLGLVLFKLIRAIRK